jgi:hypothetical protein
MRFLPEGWEPVKIGDMWGLNILTQANLSLALER